MSKINSLGQSLVLQNLYIVKLRITKVIRPFRYVRKPTVTDIKLSGNIIDTNTIFMFGYD